MWSDVSCCFVWVIILLLWEEGWADQSQKIIGEKPEPLNFLHPNTILLFVHELSSYNLSQSCLVHFTRPLAPGQDDVEPCFEPLHHKNKGTGSKVAAAPARGRAINSSPKLGRELHVRQSSAFHIRSPWRRTILPLAMRDDILQGAGNDSRESERSMSSNETNVCLWQVIEKLTSIIDPTGDYSLHDSQKSKIS